MSDPYQALSHKAAEAIATQLQAQPDSCFGLPTGRTPLGMHAILADWSRKRQLDWSHARCFALDDYLDVQEEQSFATYLEQNLYQYTNLPATNRFSPRFIEDYDDLIAACGGLDLTVVGIGSNGHVAFNEPGIEMQSWTHCTWLTESTRLSNSSFFGDIDNVPRTAVTMGMATILSSRKLYLIASGEQKYSILARALEGPMDAAIPASLLQSHHDLSILTDFDFNSCPAA